MANTLVSGFQAGLTCLYRQPSGYLNAWQIDGPGVVVNDMFPGGWWVSGFPTTVDYPYPDADGIGNPSAINVIITVPLDAPPGDYEVRWFVHNVDYPHSSPYDCLVYIWDGTVVYTVGLGPPDPGGGCSN